MRGKYGRFYWAFGIEKSIGLKRWAVCFHGSESHRKLLEGLMVAMLSGDSALVR